MMRYLATDEIQALHYWVIADYGGSHGLRDAKALASLVVTPQAVLFGRELYRSVHKKAAVYLHHCIADHPFIDGNKRTAVTLTGVFLLRNDVWLRAAPQELENIAVQIATDHWDIVHIARWLQENTEEI